MLQKGVAWRRGRKIEVYRRVPDGDKAAPKAAARKATHRSRTAKKVRRGLTTAKPTKPATKPTTNVFLNPEDPWNVKALAGEATAVGPETVTEEQRREEELLDAELDAMISMILGSPIFEGRFTEDDLRQLDRSIVEEFAATAKRESEAATVARAGGLPYSPAPDGYLIGRALEQLRQRREGVIR